MIGLAKEGNLCVLEKKIDKEGRNDVCESLRERERETWKGMLIKNSDMLAFCSSV